MNTFRYFSLTFISLLILFTRAHAQENPSIIMHDTTAGPGEVVLQVDALDFIGDNGDIPAISFRN
ncbi:MAG: hypothetical protein U5Q03_02015 [Bacteroidota bacterium]|nr:hypothetical protein [Bacteroidota bacterium]